MAISTSDERAMIAATAVSVAGGACMLWLGKRLKNKALESQANLVVPQVAASKSFIDIKPITVMAIKDLAGDKADKKINRTLIAATKLNINPRFMVNASMALDLKPATGLLGTLTAYYWDMARARHDYMKRCKQYSWCDETYVWMVRQEQFVSESLYLKHLKRTVTKKGDKNYNQQVAETYYNYAATKENFWWLLGKGTKHPKDRARLRSLENTFSNWSAPSWATGCFGLSQAQQKKINYDHKARKFTPFFVDFYDTSWWFCGTDISLKNNWSRCDSFPNNLGMGTYDRSPANNFDNLFPWHGFSRQKCSDSWGDFGGGKWDPNGPERWREVVPVNYIKMSEIPHRINYKDFPSLKFKGVGYEMRNPENTPNEMFFAKVSKYYQRGYNLVNTALDLLLARGHIDLMKEFKPFVLHCVSWGIYPPDAERAARFDDLSAIGVEPKGFTNISSADIINYVMRITPRPGTIPPWEDGGPLWNWPDQFGALQPLAALESEFPNRMFLTRYSVSKKHESWWAGFPMRLIQAESAILSSAVGNAAGAVMNSAVSAAVQYFEPMISDCVNQVMQEFIDIAKSSKIVNDAVDLIGEVSMLSSEIKKFVSARNYFPSQFKWQMSKFEFESSLPSELENMLEQAVSGTDRSAKLARDLVEDKIKRLEDYWVYTDDLLGSISSYGKEVNNIISQVGQMS